MPTIRIPQNATIEFLDEQGVKHKRPMLFVDDWIVATLTNDASFGANVKAGLAAADIIEAFRDKKPGELVVLSHDQHDRLKKVMEAPNPPFRAFVLKQISAFIKATETPVTEEQLAALQPVDGTAKPKAKLKANGAPKTLDELEAKG